MSEALVTIQNKIQSKEIEQKFGKIFSAIHRCNQDQGQQMHEAESFSFLKELSEKNLNDVSQMSALGVYLDVVRNGLSFSSASKHVYLMSRNAKVGDRWEKRLYWDTTQDGKIYQCQKSGSIDRVTRPVIVYEGDIFSEEDVDGLVKITYKRKEDHGVKVIAGFVYVVYPDGKREPIVLYPQDIDRLKGYSAKQNKESKPNALYTSGPGGQIDPGFFASKIIKFALKNIRKSGVVNAYQVETDASDAIYANNQSIEALLNEPTEPIAEQPELITEQNTNNDPF